MIDTVTFAITAGNDLGAFSLVKTADLTAEIQVADSAVLDFEVEPSFTLTITATDSTGVLDTTTVNIDLSNEPEQLVIDPNIRGVVDDEHLYILNDSTWIEDINTNSFEYEIECAPKP